MINSVERNLFFITAAGCSGSAVSLASVIFFGLYTYVNIQDLTRPLLCMPDVCQEVKKKALRALPGSVAATAISALALYASIKLTRQLRSHRIKMGLAQANTPKCTYGQDNFKQTSSKSHSNLTLLHKCPDGHLCKIL